LVGPNLPHNWVRELEEGASVPLRNRVMQCTAHFVGRMIGAFPEIEDARGLFDCSSSSTP
jgi:hypothetical protein